MVPTDEEDIEIIEIPAEIAACRQMTDEELMKVCENTNDIRILCFAVGKTVVQLDGILNILR